MSEILFWGGTVAPVAAAGESRSIPGLRAGMTASAPAVFTKYGITSPLLIAHVMAQISHECGAGHEVIENLSYSALRMTQVWPGRFPTVASAQPLRPQSTGARQQGLQRPHGQCLRLRRRLEFPRPGACADHRTPRL